MDPNETYRLLVAARAAGDDEAVCDYAEALGDWLRSGGWQRFERCFAVCEGESWAELHREAAAAQAAAWAAAEADDDDNCNNCGQPFNQGTHPHGVCFQPRPDLDEGGA